jgi:hypothetical protein
VCNGLGEVGVALAERVHRLRVREVESLGDLGVNYAAAAMSALDGQEDDAGHNLRDLMACRILATF